MISWFLIKNTSQIVGRPVCLSKYDINFIDYICNPLFSKFKIELDHILEFNAKEIDFIGEQERAFPGNEEFMKSGYYKKMLKRYLFAGSYFCSGKSVLDSCSGLGWGTSILSLFAKDITAYDLESKAIEFCRKEWKRENISWIVDDALNLKFSKIRNYDIAVAMETIEHFRKEDGIKYIYELKKYLKDDGVLIGTSSFPGNRESADILCDKNPYHYYIYTKNEMTDLLNSLFKKHVIINNWMFIAIK